jgi:hypothetical protein
MVDLQLHERKTLDSNGDGESEDKEVEADYREGKFKYESINSSTLDPISNLFTDEDETEDYKSFREFLNKS